MFDPKDLEAVDSTDALTAVYDRWLAGNGIRPACAEEVLLRPDLSDGQRRWLTVFYDRWRVVQDAEDAEAFRR